jgi:hypothetical protein
VSARSFAEALIRQRDAGPCEPAPAVEPVPLTAEQLEEVRTTGRAFRHALWSLVAIPDRAERLEAARQLVALALAPLTASDSLERH